MNQQGFKIVAILDPGVKIDKNYFLYNEGLKKEFIFKNPDNTPATRPVQLGYCHTFRISQKKPDYGGKNILQTGKPVCQDYGMT
jgi:hypothetical protein